MRRADEEAPRESVLVDPMLAQSAKLASAKSR